ncbi:hypothetical protein CR513_09392, partial [Mucuna pruriens]
MRLEAYENSHIYKEKSDPKERVQSRLKDEANNRNFKVNRHQLKPYYEGLNLSSNVGEVKIITLMEPIIPNDTLEEIFESPHA